VDQDKNQLGILEIRKALELANEQGLDLVEVSPNTDPPVCRFMDYGKYKYHNSKKQVQKKTVHVVHTKEIKLRPFTDTHDLETKLRHTQEFLEKGNKVKVTVVFRGRERRFKEQGEELINTMAEGIVDQGIIEREPQLEGHNIVMMLAPKKK